MMRSARKCVRLLPAILAAAVCLVTPDYARAGGSKDVHAPFNDGGGKTVAFVLAVTGRTEGVIPVPLEVTRETVSSQLTRTLTDQGYTVIPQKNVLELMRTWRVRDGKSIPRGFLDGLVDSLDAQLLLVANLVIQPGRMVMTARYLHPVSGIVLKVNMTESGCK